MSSFKCVSKTANYDYFNPFIDLYTFNHTSYHAMKAFLTLL